MQTETRLWSIPGTIPLQGLIWKDRMKLHMLKAILIIFIRRKSLAKAAARAESECVNILLPPIYIGSKRFGKRSGSEQLPVWLFVKGCLKHSTRRD